ncbi:E3 ubiquitin-protein ligase RNF115-like [Aethina tumida]|uniref:E3 ubiquitin-protein ligase RNF115-like n=1 Tax=Aethina tumida TaxID=116153 RepID=UPI0021488AB9|nr:E3 ubiquitin-protein ligase RNF115-like [Aethina tumida]
MAASGNSTVQLPNKGLTPQEIEANKVVHVTEDQVSEGTQCSICLEKFILNEECRETSCGHLYHGHCIGHWLTLTTTCPLCRTDLRDSQRPFTPVRLDFWFEDGSDYVSEGFVSDTSDSDGDEVNIQVNIDRR